MWLLKECLMALSLPLGSKPPLYSGYAFASVRVFNSTHQMYTSTQHGPWHKIQRKTGRQEGKKIEREGRSQCKGQYRVASCQMNNMETCITQ